MATCPATKPAVSRQQEREGGGSSREIRGRNSGPDAAAQDADRGATPGTGSASDEDAVVPAEEDELENGSADERIPAWARVGVILAPVTAYGHIRT